MAEGGSRGGQVDVLSEDFNQLLLALKTEEAYHSREGPSFSNLEKAHGHLFPRSSQKT